VNGATQEQLEQVEGQIEAAQAQLQFAEQSCRAKSSVIRPCTCAASRGPVFSAA
jgi:hypothetical protein